MKPSSIPASYIDKDELNNKLSDEKLQKKIQEIEQLRKDAVKYKTLGKDDLAKTLTTESHVAYASLKKQFPVWQDLKDARKKYGEDKKEWKKLKDEVSEDKTKITEKQKEINTLQESVDKKQNRIDDLKQKLNLESPHTAYRNSMVTYAQKYDQEHAERIEKRAGRVEELISTGLIKEDSDGVSFGGLKTASKAVQEKALQDAFGDKKDEKGNAILLPPYGRPDHQNKKSGTQKIQKKYLDAHGDKFGEWTLGSNDQLNIMRDRIRKNFDDVHDEYDELYILQLINPDLFEAMWMKDVDGNYRHCLRLRRSVSSRDVSEIIIPDGECGLFLVR